MITLLQANYGGVHAGLPTELQDGEELETGEEEGVSLQGAGPVAEDDQEDSEPMEEGARPQEGEGPLNTTWGDVSLDEDGIRGQSAGGEGRDTDLQMHWNMCKYLPEDGNCQKAFQVCGCVCVANWEC